MVLITGLGTGRRITPRPLPYFSILFEMVFGRSVWGETIPPPIRFILRSISEKSTESVESVLGFRNGAIGGGCVRGGELCFR